jgi:transposase
LCYGFGMSNSIKRDFAELERRRLKAARLLRNNVPAAEVARRVGVHRQSVSRWQRQLKASGLAGLKKAGRAGRRPKLTPDQLLELESELLKGPRPHGYSTELWTTQRIADLVRQRFQVVYHRDHIGRLLAQLGWSCQRPSGRALERDQAAVQRWKRVQWPRIKKKLNG